METLLQLINDGPISQIIRENAALFPWLESAHVMAITLVVGAIAVVDLRLLGWVWTRRPVSVLTRDVLPVTWGAFGLAASTGGLMFISSAVTYAANPFFLIKMGLLLAAFANMLVFHLVTMRGMEQWDLAVRPPGAVRAAGGVSLVVWIAIVACGRWIGFV